MMQVLEPRGVIIKMSYLDFKCEKCLDIQYLKGHPGDLNLIKLGDSQETDKKNGQSQSSRG